MSMAKKIDAIEKNFRNEAQSARDPEALAETHRKYFGRKSGIITQLLKSMGTLNLEEKKKYGPRIHSLKKELAEVIQEKQIDFQDTGSPAKEMFDATVPGTPSRVGRLHPITQMMKTIIDVFRSMGFSIASGPDIETDYYNFEALNIPKDHPARDMQDTFYLEGDFVLRTHTSPVQIRVMENTQPPVRVIAPGKVYRRDADISHTPMFHQVEGLVVDEGITMAHLMDVLDQFIKTIFSSKVKTRFRPSFFSFTEPSAEVDVSCVLCEGQGCRVCKNSGWLEILGAGMVDPEVFRHVKFDSERYTGYAFGMGVERIAMLKYGIDDIRLFYENDVRFLEQF